MTDPIRAALERLIEALDDYEPVWGGFPESALAAARAALAGQQGEGPSDEELNILWNCSGIADEHGNHTGNIFEFARAVLARWGHQPTPPAEGEVAEFITQLKSYAEYGTPIRLIPFVITRAAELLQQQHPAPVPVSERLPEPNTKVLAHYFNALGNGRTICAIWVPAKSRSEDSGDDDFTEYDEENDTYYWPEGWYEAIENWDDLGWVAVNEGEVAYWQPLPKWPALPLPQGEVE